MPGEMGRYGSVLLGNAFFVCLSRIYFIYFAVAHTSMCVHVEVSSYVSVFKHIWEGARWAAPPFGPGTCHGDAPMWFFQERPHRRRTLNKSGC